MSGIMSLQKAQTHKKNKGMSAWYRRSATLVAATMVGTTALTGIGATPAVAAPYESLGHWELVNASTLTNADGSWNWDIMSHGGHAWDAEAEAWRLGRAGWSGIFDSNEGASHFPTVSGSTYSFATYLRAASPEFAGAQVNLSAYPGGHLANIDLSYDEWTMLEGTATATQDGQRFRVTSDVDGLELLVANASMFRLVGDETTDPEGPEVPGSDVVFAVDFEDGEIAGGDGGQFAVVDNPLGEGLVQRITTAASWHGLQIPANAFTPGATYRFQADVLAPAGTTDMVARFEGANDPWPWVVGNHPMSDTAWSTISGEFTWDGISPMPVRLVNGGAGVFYADNVIVTRIGAAPEVPEEGGPTVVRTWDFSDAADLASFEGAGDASFAIVADEDAANGHALRVDMGGDDWETARITVPSSNLGEYRLDVTIRLENGEGQLQPRALPGWTYMGNQNITDSYTTVSSGTLPTLGETQIGLHVVPGGSTFFVDQIDLVQVTAPPVIDENFEFERLEWDFEDGTSQGWFGRTAADGFGVVTPGADSSYAIGVWDRTDQGSGPMFDIDEDVRPGQRLEFSADVRFTEPVSDNRLTLSIQNGPASFTNLIQNMEVAANGDWTRVEGIFVVPAFTNMARLYLESPWAQGAQGETAAFQIDNIVIDVPAPLQWEQDLVPLSVTLPGINTGVAVDSRDLIDEMGEVINHHFTKLVGENHMKPDAWWTAGTGANVNWNDGLASFRIHPEARSIMDFAVEHDMDVFHHVMIWHSQVPNWFFTPDNSTQEFAPTVANQEEMVRRIWEYTRVVAGGIAAEYGLFGSSTNPVTSIEVANEVVHGGGSATAGDATHNLRPNSPWTRIFAPVEGSEWTEAGHWNRDWFLYEAFQAADYYFNFVFNVTDARGRLNGNDSRLSLWINDYNTERGLVSPDNPATKRFQLLQVVNRLLEAGAPLDGVGHQFHAGLIHPVVGLQHALDLFAVENGFVTAPVRQAVTEIDVTIPSRTEANLVAQGHYYREAFDIIRNHQVRHGDIDTVTIWGLNDSRSWRADQFPLLFNDDLTAKPAFHGAVYSADLLAGDEGSIWDDWTRPELPTTVQHAYAFAEDIVMDESAFASATWDALPSHRLTGPAANPGSFELRYNSEALFVLADVPFGDRTPAAGGGRNEDTRLEVSFGDAFAEVRLGAWDVTDGVEVITYDAGASFRAVIRFPLSSVAAGDTASLDLFTFNGVDTPYIGGIQASGSERGAWTTRGAHGSITFSQPLAFVQIPVAETAPVLGEFDADVWNSAATLSTDVHQSGSADGARADARAVWHDNGTFATLYMAIDVNDTTPDVTAGEAHEQDSVEIFLGLGDRAADGGRMELYDAQFRVSRAGVESFGGGLGWANPQRLRSAVVDNGTDGYRVMVAIDLRTGTGHQVGQWTNNPLNDARVQAFDLQVNDAANGARTSVFAWANHTGEGHALTTHWGSMQLVESIPAPVDPVDPVDPPVVEPSHPTWSPDVHWMPGNIVFWNGQLWIANRAVPPTSAHAGQEPGVSRAWDLYVPEVEAEDVLVGVTAEVHVQQLPGNTNIQTVVLVEEWSLSGLRTFVESFNLANNGTFSVEVNGHTVDFRIQGNTQVRSLEVLGW